MRDLTQVKNLLGGKDLTLEEANTAAEELSVKHWNRYFFVIPQGDGLYSLSAYHDDSTTHHYLCGKKYDKDGIPTK